MKLSTKITVLAAAIVGGTALTGIAVAGTPSADGTITACVASNGTPRIVDTEAGQTCTSTEKKLSWGSGWTHRGVYDATQTYAVGDVVILPKLCSTSGLAYQEGRSTWLKVAPGPNPPCLLESSLWKALSVPPFYKEPPRPTGPVGVQINLSDAGTSKFTPQFMVKVWGGYATNEAWIQTVGVPDVRNCEVTATPVTTQPGATVERIPASYTDWIDLRTWTGTSPAKFPLDVLINCPRNADGTMQATASQPRGGTISGAKPPTMR